MSVESDKTLLRQRAESTLRVTRTEVAAMPPEDVQALVHELQVHQVELEMQNEELRAAQLELSETRDRYSDLYEFAPVGYVTILPGGKIFMANLTATSMLGVERRQMMGAKLSQFIAPASQDAYFRHQREAFEASARLSREFEMQHVDHSVFHVRLQSTPVHDNSGNIVQCRVAMVSIEALKKAEAKLLEANADLEQRVESRTKELALLNRELEQRVAERSQQLEEAQDLLVRKEKLAALGQVAGSVAHEIRNPLSVIRSGVYYLNQAMQDKDKDKDKDSRDAFAEINRGLSGAGSVLDELLDFTRDVAPDLSDFAVGDALSEALRDIQVSDAYTITLPSSTLSHRCRADQAQITRIFSNLITNAIQAMPQGGEITVSTERVGGLVRIDVQDNGPGISAEDLPHVFEPLFSRRVEGVGLGLALSQRYATLNHGRLVVESTVGKGTTFILAIPSADV